MIALLMSWGLSRAWSWVVAIGAPILLVVGALLALDAWGDRRFRAGEAASDAAWKAASDKLIAEAATSANAATRKEAARIADHAAKVEQEKEKIDAAIANGSSQFDALFPAAGGVRP